MQHWRFAAFLGYPSLVSARESRNAVVLLSGGMDSATALAIAREQGFICSALSFDYGQRHRFELEAAARVARAMEVREHLVIRIDLRAFGGSALTAVIDVPKDRLGACGSRLEGRESSPSLKPQASCPSTIPITYVPARNTIFLSLALAYAETREARDIFIGVNAIDYSGYPDCRPEFIQAFERMANLGTKAGVEGDAFTIHAPLIDLTKAQIIRRGWELGVDYSLTFSCYDPDTAGSPCGRCDACVLREVGFREADERDPVSNAVRPEA